MKANYGSKMFDGVNYSFLFFLMCLMLFPFVHVAALSLSGESPVMKGEVLLLPKQFNIDTYKLVLRDADVLRAYWNTIIYTFVGTIINMAFTTITAYVIANERMVFRKSITFFITFTMMFSGGLIPGYLVVKNLGMVDTIWAVTIPGAISTWNLLVMRQFFIGLPKSLEESAMVDGANDPYIFVKIILPLSKAILAAITLFYAVGHWNSFFGPLIYLNDPKKYPLQIILRKLVIQGHMTMESSGADQQYQNQMAINIKYTVLMIAVIPILMIYPFMQKYFVKGMLIGSIKG